MALDLVEWDGMGWDGMGWDTSGERALAAQDQEEAKRGGGERGKRFIAS